jgi:hypothetical protein
MRFPMRRLRLGGERRDEEEKKAGGGEVVLAPGAGAGCSTMLTRSAASSASRSFPVKGGEAERGGAAPARDDARGRVTAAAATDGDAERDGASSTCSSAMSSENCCGDSTG